MKKTLVSIFLIVSLFSSASVHGMSCKINNICVVVNEIFQIVNDLTTSGIDVNCSGFDEVSAQISSFEAIVLSQLNVIENSINGLSFSSEELLCMPISMPTTITAAGSYCLSQNIAGSITIDASNVTLDLNGYQVATGIIITSEQNTVSITNGSVVGGSPGIWVQSECTNISITNVLAKNGTQGILFERVNQGLVEHCTLTSNMTGLSLIGSTLINVVNTVATSNACAGFDLVSSTENCLTDCKAIATGASNSMVTNNFVTGFVSMDGSQNIFERCIANGTQAPLTTDSNSIVAGFALLGTEQNSKIIGCESANTSASNAGVTVPYGILLEGALSNVSAVTGEFPYMLNDQVHTVQFSPDGQYVAVGGMGLVSALGTQFQIFAFDRIANSVTALAGMFSTGSVNSVDWSPDGQYVAVGGNSLDSAGNQQLQVLYFNPINNSATVVAGAFNASGDIIYSVNWSADGNYLAVGGSSLVDGYPGNNQLQVFTFDRVRNLLTAVAGGISDPGLTGVAVHSVDWSPDDQYIAVGFDSAGQAINQLQIFSFDSTLNALISVAGQFNVGGDDAPVETVVWSPNGQYVAMGYDSDNSGDDGDLLQLFSFDRLNPQLFPVASQFDWSVSYDVFSIDWSPDGQYLVVGGSALNGLFSFIVLGFDEGMSQLNVLANNFLFDVNPILYAVDWSPDGQYIALGGVSLGYNLLTNFQIFTALNFPSQNVISDNTVYCNGETISANLSWGTRNGATGVGISGTSICNMITRNTAYNNPPVSSNFFVPSNYQFVTNVFNQAFGQGPTALQNISLNACDPIIAPVDVGLLSQQILYNVTVCAPTPVLSAETISASGIYCLSQNMTGNCVISASGVSLDLNNYKVTGTINVLPSQNQVTIKNGVVDANGGETGIWVEGNNVGITISNVTVKNANSDMNSTGIVFYSAQDVTIEKCTLTQNSIGLQLNSSYNVQVSDTVASSNMNAGFDLISSSTNSFINCKALSTGQNNAVIYNNEVVGFSSSNGYGNIFENCIANATQALSTTDSNSTIAGFALLGSESCTKIIGCESANASASESGVTVPYGILLQGTLDGLLGVTGALDPNYPPNNDIVASANWSPDGQYLAVGGQLYSANDGAGYALQIYSFNRLNNTLIAGPGALDPSYPINGNDFVHSVNWSPDGQYIAVGGQLYSANNGAGYALQIYSFDRSSNTLLALSGALSFSDVVLSLNWSPDGQYLAVGGIFSYSLQIYSFNRLNNTLLAGPGVLNPGSDSTSSVNWSPDGQYVAVGGSLPSVGHSLQIYSFDRSSNRLLAGPGEFDPNPPNSDGVVSVSWSPDGQYLAVGGVFPSVGYSFQIYNFDRSSNILLAGPEAFKSSFDGIDSISWSSDGQYLVLGGQFFSVGYSLQIYSFDRSSNTLQAGPGAFNPNFNDEDIYSADWSPDGQYVAAGGQIFSVNSPFGFGFEILTALQFPSQNVIADNIVYCNGHDVSATFTGATGVGISGTSICNMIIGNTVYNNPPITSNFFVPSNYQFVTNVFNQAFGQGPTALQNISLNACQPIVAPVNVGLLSQQILYLLQSVADRIFAG